MKAISQLKGNKKEKILKHFASKQDSEVKKANVNIENDFDKEFELEHVYKKRIEHKIPNSDLD